MSPIQQMLLGVGAVATKTYVDDVFSTYLWKGTAAQKTITNGIDLSTKGGMVWIKGRDQTYSHYIFDTERGATNSLVTNTSAGYDTVGGALDQFNTDGFRVGSDTTANGNNFEMASWTWRKAPGFFDCVKWQGNGTAGRQISHSLGCVPGLIIIKGTDLQSNWMVYHRDLGDSTTNSGNFHLWLNGSSSKQDDNTVFNDTLPTASNFTVGTSGHCNGNNYNYVAYVFAGGESTQNEAVSVDFDGSGDYLSLASSSDLAGGSNSDLFTIELWIKPDSWSTDDTVLIQGNSGYWIHKDGSNFKFGIFGTGGMSNYDLVTTTEIPEEGQWTHVAVVKLAESGGSNPLKMFFNGTQVGSGSANYTWPSGEVKIGSDGSNHFDGKISNFRFTKAAVYTSSFRPPTEPLTNITNTKLLCCNNSSTTGSTVTPGTITANGNPTASSDSPFDDPAAFTFGDSQEGVIKCGSYTGNGSTDGPEINLGWEPSFIILKCSSHSGESWEMYDSMRGAASTSEGTAFLRPNEADNEATGTIVELNPTGFKLKDSSGSRNNDGKTYIYIAIRRPDGYVGKPPELGSSVFTPVYDTANAPMFKTPNHDVDFTFQKDFNVVKDWNVAARLIQGKRLETNTAAAEEANQYQMGDYSRGWSSYTGGDGSRISYNFKRHAGFDVVTYKGNGNANHQIPHSLNKTIEMMWVKNTAAAENWIVYHKALDGGTNPETHYLRLNTTDSEIDDNVWSDVAPTSTHFTVGDFGRTNGSNQKMIAMLFASVSGVSSVGSFTGDGSNDGSHEITCGFTPRFLIIKCVTSGVNYSHWRVWDSLMNLDGSGSESYLKLNSSDAKVDGYDYIDTTSTGFKFNTNFGPVNGNGNKMIYYAHA